ncbi:MAG: hypothetical protein R2831_06450 [Chitinophagaceae bacterium]
MKKIVIILVTLICFQRIQAQEVYTMGYESAMIAVVDPNFFSTLTFPDQPSECGYFDKASETFYTCNQRTFRYVDEEYVSSHQQELCCNLLDFDPHVYYGTMTLKGIIDTVEWDNLVFYFTTDKARLKIRVDEREIDALYEHFYKEGRLGKVHLILRLKTFDTPNENVLSYNKNTEWVRKPQRKFIKLLRW